MRLFVLVNPGLEDAACQEIQEIIDLKPKKGSVIAITTTEEKALMYLTRTQAARRVLLALVNGSREQLIIPKNAFPVQAKIGLTIEGVKGQEQRTAIARSIIEKNKDFSFDYKQPDITIIVYADQDQFYMGIDLGGELNNRAYRVFPHSASFKGDHAYAILRQSRFGQDQKLFVGFCKDGALAIEAAFYSLQKPLREVEETQWKKVMKHVPMPRQGELIRKEEKEKVIFAFDENQQNITAARKNAQLAGVRGEIDITKITLDDVDAHYGQKIFDTVIFQITTKDEEKINEVYYQASSILKKRGYLLLIGRKNWELSISTKFNLKKTQDLVRGDSTLRMWVLELK